ncbi:unnamed protein product [Medioppia subpectinata]|uniref:Nuclear receptor domain-containing protein n=1 Tax=Medioppia subpectinata TaxID=1979941 RepID=A0A7R9KSF6_9ACAR|nr:unnamed protein product [Medioppia subpectinata]CAG2108934.1 unnamed protein product [Medioppia subpectinata]
MNGARNAFKENQLKCGFEHNCNITLNTRKYCQKCRLNKCFAVGMRKEIMNSDKENKKRRQLIAENKQKSKQNIQTNSVHNIPELDSNDTEISDQTVGQETNDDNLIENSMPLPLVPVFKELTDYNGSNQLETNRMQELLNASNIINYPIADNVIVVQNKDHLIRMAAPATEAHYLLMKSQFLDITFFADFTDLQYCMCFKLDDIFKDHARLYCCVVSPYLGSTFTKLCREARSYRTSWLTTAHFDLFVPERWNHCINQFHHSLYGLSIWSAQAAGVYVRFNAPCKVKLFTCITNADINGCVRGYSLHTS